MWYTLLVCSLLLSSVAGATGQTSFDYTVTNVVDTNNADVRKILTLWISYLGSNPDSAYDNPHWNAKEKAEYGLEYFDFAGHSLFANLSARDLVETFKPTVLSIYGFADHYEIRTLFYSDGLPPESKGSNPPAIIRVAAIKEDGEWKLANILPFVTSKWIARQYGRIRYFSSPNHQFNAARAEEAKSFVDSLERMFGTTVAPFTYYVTPSAEELGVLLGHDFFFFGLASGQVIANGKIVMAGFGSEHYPHEFVHLATGDVPNKMISEGVATWLGGSRNLTYEQNLAELRDCLSKADSVTLEKIATRQWGWQCNALYTTGAVIVELVHKRGGIAAVKRLFQAPKEVEALLPFIADALGVAPDELNEYVLRAIAERSR